MADSKPGIDGRKSFRRSLRKWRDKLRRDKPAQTPPSRPSTAGPSLSTPTPIAPHATSTSTPISPPSSSTPIPPAPPDQLPPAALIFKPTTQTTIHSPADPRNRKRISSAPQISRPFHDRRKTAPADFFALSGIAGSDGGVKTTISSPAAGTLNPKSRFRLSISKRSSRYIPTILERPASGTPSTTTSTSSRPPISTTTSSPAPADHANRRVTLQATTASEMAAKLESEKERLESAAEVIRRDKPKDVLDPGRGDKEDIDAETVLREKEEETSERQRVETADAETVGKVSLTSTGEGTVC
ncbi:hypothetical protein P154DRAFT_13689 [Amniculicola lignicola CBS 123094]|uniref:Uncharacterized protein n=1 Tax=Amniculicola lignicola CBS 123094 TaxID=1392246 RepID=A0A6A5X529_9PLEO|nr:hypothetical protein P154DRAFT_13689 [Amniculicola lignicola CBS 123094]